MLWHIQAALQLAFQGVCFMDKESQHVKSSISYGMGYLSTVYS